MGRKLKLKKRKKEEKERPFDDSDTAIQWREDFVQDYVKEPLQRKAVETPVVERVVTEDMEKDMLVNDEDDNIGVRTREKQLPAMPLDAEFMNNMRDSIPTTILKDVQNNLRFYNDAIRNPATSELAKVFLLGVIRQLRYWAMTQTPQVDVEKGQTAVDWVLNSLLGRVKQDMSLLAKHFTPEIDKVYFRRWALELNILKQELHLRKDISDTERAQIQEQGFDPLNPDAVQQIDIPNQNILSWITKHPRMVDIVLGDPIQREKLLGLVWSEVFNHDGNIQYLNLLVELKSRASMDAQQADSLNTVLKNLQNGNEDGLLSLQQDGSFSNLKTDIHLATSTLRGTHGMNVLQDLFSAFGTNPDNLSTKARKGTETLSSIVHNIAH
jgi:hypothetical protein